MHGMSVPRDAAMDVARNIVNQIGDRWAELIPSDRWVGVRQSTNDELDKFVRELIVAYAKTEKES